MPLSTRILGVRLSAAGIAPYRERLIEHAKRAPNLWRILTAYFDEETFSLLRELEDAGANAMQILLAANQAGRKAWEAARDFAAKDPSRLEVRLGRTTASTILHPKLVLVDHADEALAIIGSSNLTAGGTRRNVELNLELLDDAPVPPASPISILSTVFDDLFSASVTPTPTLWADLIAEAPERTQAEGRALGKSQPSAISGVPILGSPSQPAPIAPTPTPAPTPSASTQRRSLLIDLSAADVRRRPWDPAGAGTAQLNLPREAVGQVPIPTGAVPAEAMGVDQLAGTTETLEVSFWPREPRGPGRVPEAPRFTFTSPAKEFIQEDLDRAPQLGDVLVLEFPSTAGVVDPIRVAVVGRDHAQQLGIVPMANERGADPWPDGTPLRWEIRDGSVI